MFLNAVAVIWLAVIMFWMSVSSKLRRCGHMIGEMFWRVVVGEEDLIQRVSWVLVR